MIPSNIALRRKIRQQRRALSAADLRHAEYGLLKSARQCRQIWFSNRVLSYAPFEGEISPHAITKHLPTHSLLYPRIVNYRTCAMQFFQANLFSTRNRFGIREPIKSSSPLFANQLDLVLLPLLAFDRTGNRLGMGAGYYDRALQALVHQPSTRPRLIGLAHSFQEVESIQAQPWDVTLDAIITEDEYIPVSLP